MPNARLKWLRRAEHLLRPEFRARGFTIPRISLELGRTRAYTGDNGERRYYSGTFFPLDSHILISNRIRSGDNAFATIFHELAHATTPGDGHKGQFRELAAAWGFRTGDLLSYPNHRGSRFHRVFGPILKKLGPYPRSTD